MGFSKPAIIRKVVVFPHPDGPRKETNSPPSTSQVEILDGGIAYELLANMVESEKGHQFIPFLRLVSVVRYEMTPIALQVSEAEDVRAAGSDDLAAGQVGHVGPKGVLGHIERNGQLADNDGKGQEAPLRAEPLAGWER